MSFLIEITPAYLYRIIGKNDSIFTIFFNQDSELIKNLCEYIIVSLDYSKDEREKFESNNDEYINNYSKGIIRINIITPDLSTEEKIKYKLDGINCSEIDRVLYFPQFYKQEFNENEIKEVPNIIKIPFISKDKYDYENFTIALYSKIINHNEGILYDEKLEYLGILTAFKERKINTKLLERLQISLEELKTNPIFWIGYYKTKEKLSDLTLQEKLNLQNYKFDSWIEKNTIFLQQLLDCGFFKDKENFDEEKINFIVKEIEDFKTSRFGFGDPLIYWDLKSYLHIILGHIKESKLGLNNKDNSEIPYKITDLKTLIGKILDQIEDDIEHHFKTKSNKKFHRGGNRAIYFNNDYFSIDIEIDGRLSSFYKL